MSTFCSGLIGWWSGWITWVTSKERSDSKRQQLEGKEEAFYQTACNSPRQPHWPQTETDETDRMPDWEKDRTRVKSERERNTIHPSSHSSVILLRLVNKKTFPLSVCLFVYFLSAKCNHGLLYWQDKNLSTDFVILYKSCSCRQIFKASSCIDKSQTSLYCSPLGTSLLLTKKSSFEVTPRAYSKSSINNYLSSHETLKYKDPLVSDCWSSGKANLGLNEQRCLSPLRERGKETET